MWYLSCARVRDLGREPEFLCPGWSARDFVMNRLPCYFLVARVNYEYGALTLTIVFFKWLLLVLRSLLGHTSEDYPKLPINWFVNWRKKPNQCSYVISSLSLNLRLVYIYIELYNSNLYIRIALVLSVMQYSCSVKRGKSYNILYRIYIFFVPSLSTSGASSYPMVDLFLEKSYKEVSTNDPGAIQHSIFWLVYK